MVECDDQTAELHMAMAEMMGEDEKQANIEPGPDDQLNVMQFTTIQDTPMEIKISCIIIQ